MLERGVDNRVCVVSSCGISRSVSALLEKWQSCIEANSSDGPSSVSLSTSSSEVGLLSTFLVVLSEIREVHY